MAVINGKEIPDELLEAIAGGLSAEQEERVSAGVRELQRRGWDKDLIISILGEDPNTYDQRASIVEKYWI